ncbi:MAG: glucosaminidase domain-containing protein [Steroidobacteraceae bacterium]
MGAVPAVRASFGDAETLTSLKRTDRSQTPEALRETARQFESLFTRMLLKSMRATSFDDSMAGQGEGFYRDMFDDQLSIELSKGKGLGLADMLVEQLKRTGLAGTDAAAGVPIAGDAPTVGDARKDQFVQALWPDAAAAGAELGVDPKTLIAHAALETGWGRHLPQGEDGRPSHNLFGVKATGWSGERVQARTLEFADGEAQARTEPFRAYGSTGESFRDYVALIRDNPRYAAAKGTGTDAAAYARALQAGGYATDPDYAAKLERVADVLKFTPTAPIGRYLET